MGIGRIFKAWRYSMQGLSAAIRHEAAFRQELILAVVLVPCAFALGRSITEISMLLGAILVVLITELLNSAIEAVADAVSLEAHPLIGRAKDIGSAAVWLAFLLLILIWGGVALSRFL